MALIVPAVLPSSKADLEDKLARLAKIRGVKEVQIDAVDGKYASPACWPYTAPAELKQIVRDGALLPHAGRLSFEADLMTQAPEAAASVFLAAGATRVAVHAESVPHLPRVLASLKSKHGFEKDFAPGLVSIGVAIGIATELSLIEPAMPSVDFVQFMGISKIGRQGQLFDRRVIEKIHAFKNRYPRMPLQVDGGVTIAVAKDLLALGVDRLVVGSAIVGVSDMEKAFNEFEALLTPYGV